jgi:hypothetical protein
MVYEKGTKAYRAYDRVQASGPAKVGDRWLQEPETMH